MTDHILTLGAATYDPRDMSLTAAGGGEIDLSNKAREVLACLADAAGEVVARETLVNTVWPEVPVEETTLARVIAELRLAIGDREKVVIRGLPRVGFQLSATRVDRIEPERQRRPGWVWLAVACLVLAAILTYGLLA